jgi:hypothetical protein
MMLTFKITGCMVLLSIFSWSRYGSNEGGISLLPSRLADIFTNNTIEEMNG